MTAGTTSTRGPGRQFLLSPIPVIADIHFPPRYVFTAIDTECAAVR